jgi:peptidyl-prolyl cis-trans isomerase D
MSVIQKIREKYATLMIVAICLSLVAFLLMDALVGPKSIFHHSTAVAEIDGQDIDYRDYINQEQEAENAAQQQNPNLTDADRQQIRDQVWSQILSDAILGKEYSTLGIGVTTEEITDQAATPDADEQIKAIPLFKDPQTGEFDPARVVQFVRNINQDQTGRSLQLWDQIQEYLEKTIPRKKFYSLVSQALYYPKWLAEMEIKDRSTNADISYVSVPYTTIPDSAVKVTDDELQQYLDTHKLLFHQDAGRSIEYVSFDVIPTSDDSASLLKQMNQLKQNLINTDTADIPGFINRNSDIPYYDAYLTKSQIQAPNKDSVFDLPVGGVYGPYIDNGDFTIAKMIDKREIPDTVKVRHILISTQSTPDSVAKQRIDSIAKAIQGGASFAAMAEKYSDDPGSKHNGGVYTFSAQQIQDPNFTPEFRQFILYDGKTGDKKIVKGSMGYFYIEILDQKDFSPAVKVAFLSKNIIASQETENDVYGEANEFAGNNRTREAFEKSVQSQKLNMRTADNIAPTDYVIPNVGQARQLIQWMYNDAKIGDVSNVYSLDNKYVVAVLTGIRKEGTASLGEVRPEVAAEVIRKKKGKIIAEKIGNPTSLKELSSRLNLPVQQAQNVNFTTPYMPSAGFEPKVVGMVFNKSLGIDKLSSPVPGNNGVYILKVDSLINIPQTMDIKTVQESQEMTIQSSIISGLFDMMKKESNVVDNRIKFE